MMTSVNGLIHDAADAGRDGQALDERRAHQKRAVGGPRHATPRTPPSFSCSLSRQTGGTSRAHGPTGRVTVLLEHATECGRVVVVAGPRRHFGGLLWLPDVDVPRGAASCTTGSSAAYHSAAYHSAAYLARGGPPRNYTLRRGLVLILSRGNG